MGAEANISIFVAFVSGLLSFISPCVLPLVPTYISYLSARAVQQASVEMTVVGVGTATSAKSQKNRTGLLLHALFLVGGFTVFFVVFGLLTNVGLNLLGDVVSGFKEILPKLGGTVMIIFGLHIMGFTGWVLKTLDSLFTRASMGTAGQAAHRVIERIQVTLYGGINWYVDPKNPYGLAGSALMGVVLAAAWMPCIGAIYGAIIGLSLQGSRTQAAVLLTAYSIGLGVPFLLTAVALDRVRGILNAMKRQMRLIEATAGIFLIAMGLLLVSNQLTLLAQSTGWFADLAYNFEECTTGTLRGTVDGNDWGLCMQIGVSKLAFNQQQGGANGEVAQPAPKPQTLIGLDLGYRAPTFTAQLLNGKEVSLESLRGKYVLLNFWATWCGPCRAEMPYFQTLADRYSAGNFAILAVDFQESKAKVGPYIDNLKVNYNIGLDPKGEISALYQAVQLPVSYIIAPDGTILVRQYGPFNTQALEASLDKWVSSTF
jgi:cytochrome c-type biogenesis protein